MAAAAAMARLADQLPVCPIRAFGLGLFENQPVGSEAP